MKRAATENSSRWLERCNAVVRLRNLLVRPLFIAYKLTFLLPGVKTLLERHGFEVEVRELFEGKWAQLRLVTATLNEHRVDGMEV